jgi:hypothetical protein
LAVPYALNVLPPSRGTMFWLAPPTSLSAVFPPVSRVVHAHPATAGAVEVVDVHPIQIHLAVVAAAAVDGDASRRLALVASHVIGASRRGHGAKRHVSELHHAPGAGRQGVEGFGLK